MPSRLALLAVVFLMVPRSAFPQNQSQIDRRVVHGTVNIALGNKNGMVVLTDSMLTREGRQLPTAGQKLFKLDDRTVCAFAGFFSAKAPMPDLNTSTGAIIREYTRQSTGQPTHTIAAKPRSLAFLLMFHISLISHVLDPAGTDMHGNYALQLIVAGYDVDNKPKIGKVTIGIPSDGRYFDPEIEYFSVVNVEDKLVYRLNGMPDVAEYLLAHPDSKPRDVALSAYVKSMNASGGASLTAEQMVSVSRRLALYTSIAHPEVGGPSQLAVFRPDRSVTIEQQSFPVPPRPLVNFALIVQSEYTYAPFGIAPGVHGVFIGCKFKGVKGDLDGHFFVENTFTDSELVYSGEGDINLGNTNHVTNSLLVIEPLLDLNNKSLGQVESSFPWSRIVVDIPRGTW